MRMAVLVVSSLLGLSPAVAQSPPRETAPTAARFDLASIKPASFPNDDYFAGFAAAGTCNPARPQRSGDRVRFANTTLCGLIRFAFDVRDYQIVDKPGWMTKVAQSSYYEVETLVASGSAPTQDQLRQMVRTLLEDRFRLAAHPEPRELPVYALVVARDGPRFGAGTEEQCRNKPKETMVTAFGGRALFGSCSETTPMQELVRTLNLHTDRAVVDRTGLAGRYAFILQWTPDGVTPSPDAPPSLFTAVQEQLGLRLEPQRLAVEALVIDRAEPPSPN
jgi:uncharacterized protein (TIGR03435 family)